VRRIQSEKRALEPKPQSTTAIIPVDSINEVVIICAAITDPERGAKLLATLPPDSFYGTGHAAIWTGLQDIQRKGLHYDPATLQQVTAGHADAAMVERYLEKRPAAPPNLAHHVEALHWDRARVEATRGPIQGLLDALRDMRSEPEKVRAMARSVGSSFDNAAGSQRWLRDPEQLVHEQMAIVLARRDGLGWHPFGFPGFDIYGREDGEEKEGHRRVVIGAAPGKVTLVTGTPGSGKTTLVSQFAVNQAKLGRKVAFGAWEQGSGPSLELCAAIDLGVSLTALQEGRLREEDYAQLRVRMTELSHTIRFFDLPFGRVRGEKGLNDRAIDLVHQVIADCGCEVFVADLLRRAFRQFEPDEEEHALYRMQAVAQETRTHHVWVHQLRKQDINSRNGRPTREDLKGSAAWSEVPDLVLGVFRPGLLKAVDDSVLCVDILKQRQGTWPLSVEFDWDPEHGKITNGRGVPYEYPGARAAVAQSDNEIDQAVALPSRRKWR
jgi:replicative DNA helicase